MNEQMTAFDQLVQLANQRSRFGNDETTTEFQSWLFEACHLMKDDSVSIPVYTAAGLDEHFGHIASLRRLFDALLQECTRSLSNRQYDLAVICSIGIFDLGRIFRCGGLNLDLLVSVALIDSAVSSVQQMRRRLSSAARQDLLQAIERWEHDCDPTDTIFKRDHQWEIDNAEDETDFLQSSMGGETDDQPQHATCEERWATKMIQDAVNSPQEQRCRLYSMLNGKNVVLVNTLKHDLRCDASSWTSFWRRVLPW